MRRSEALQMWRRAVFAIVLTGMALLGTGVSSMGSSMPVAQVAPA